MNETAKAILDVVVLGAGPAGSAAARMLASMGHSVVVLSRGAAREPMAESLPPSAGKLLERVGLKDAVDTAGFVRSTGNSVRWGGSIRPEAFGNDALGWQVRRDRFDEALLGEARRAGATVLTNVSVREVSERGSDGTREVSYDVDERQSVRARWVLDCTGRSGVFARRGWRSDQHAARTLAICGVWECADSWRLDDETHTVVESYDAGWAWSIPVSASQRYVTVMVDPAHTAIGPGTALLVTYERSLRRTESMRDLVARATLIGTPFARESSPYGFGQAGEEGVLLVGDAASFVDPLSSFGMKKAFASAWLAALVVHASLRDAATTSPALQLYEEREREMHVELQRQAAALASDAAVLHTSDFWSDRSAVSDAKQSGLAPAESVRGAFEKMKNRPDAKFQRAPSLQLVPKAMVSGDDIVVVPHLVHPAIAHGIRFLRNVDVVHLTELASAFDQVPDLYDAYNRRTKTPVALSDFLVALSTLVATGALELLDSPRATP
jgi:flavin-dependent dehydrogenase